MANDNQFITAARLIAEKSGCAKQATGAVIVVNQQIAASGCNAGKKMKNCPRVAQNFPTGQGYHLCKQLCEQIGHAEETCVNNFLNKKFVQTGEPALYLWGHWWCCEPCWKAMIGAGINTVYLVENATELFS